MTEYLNELVCLVVEDFHGTFLAHIFRQLVYYGRLSHFHVAQRCHLPIKHAKSGLAALIQLRLVQYHTSQSGFSTYQADIDQAYRLVRIGKVIALAHAKCGTVAALVVEQIAANGSLAAAQITDKVNFAFPSNETMAPPKIKRALRTLTSNGFIKRVRPAHSQIIHDAREDIDHQVQQRPGVDPKAKGKRAQEHQASLVKAELELHFDSRLTLESFDTIDDQEVPLDGVGESSNHINDDLYVCIDFDVAVRSSRQKLVCQTVEKALGRNAGRVAHAALSQIDLPSGLGDTTVDALRSPLVQTLALSNIRDTLSQSEATPENGVNHTNGYHADVHMTNGVDEKETENHDCDRYSLDNSLLLIAEGPFPFLARDAETLVWTINALTLSRWIRDKEIDNIIQQRVGPIGLRIKRMLTVKGKLEEKNIQDLGLLVAKELRQTLARLETQGLIELQEVPREPQRQPNRTMFLWFFDADRAAKVLLGDLYKIMARLFQVLNKERENLKGTFEKLSRVSIDGKPEEYLLGEERKVYMQWQRKETWLMAEIERLDDSVALLRDM